MLALALACHGMLLGLRAPGIPHARMPAPTMADSLQLSRREALLLLPLTLAGVGAIRYATTDAFPVSLEGPIGVYSTPVDMRGKTVVITGSNTGIGYETALRLAESGATVVTLPCFISQGEGVARSRRRICRVRDSP